MDEQALGYSVLAFATTNGNQYGQPLAADLGIVANRCILKSYDVRRAGALAWSCTAENAMQFVMLSPGNVDVWNTVSVPNSSGVTFAKQEARFKSVRRKTA
eukprot:16462-Amphidinium_carterae.1